MRIDDGPQALIPGLVIEARVTLAVFALERCACGDQRREWWPAHRRFCASGRPPPRSMPVKITGSRRRTASQSSMPSGVTPNVPEKSTALSSGIQKARRLKRFSNTRGGMPNRVVAPPVETGQSVVPIQIDARRRPGRTAVIGSRPANYRPQPRNRQREMEGLDRPDGTRHDSTRLRNTIEVMVSPVNGCGPGA